MDRIRYPHCFCLSFFCHCFFTPKGLHSKAQGRRPPAVTAGGRRTLGTRPPIRFTPKALHTARTMVIGCEWFSSCGPLRGTLFAYAVPRVRRELRLPPQLPATLGFGMQRLQRKRPANEKTAEQRGRRSRSAGTACTPPWTRPTKKSSHVFSFLVSEFVIHRLPLGNAASASAIPWPLSPNKQPPPCPWRNWPLQQHRSPCHQPRQTRPDLHRGM